MMPVSQLLVALLGTPLGAIIALGGVWFNTRTTAKQAAAGRAAEHADRVRDEIAEILEQRRAVMDSQQRLFSTALILRNRDETSDERDRLFADRDRHVAACHLLEQTTIRASLRTGNARIVAALHELRTIAEQPLKPMDITTNRPEDGAQHRPDKTFTELKTRTRAAFSTLEAATREATAIDHTVIARPAVQPGGGWRRLGRRARTSIGGSAPGA